MKTTSIIKSALSLTLASTLFLGCSSSSDDPITYAATGVIVDPYIVGAVMCEDENTDGTCDANEQLSTASDENGEYKFQNALQVGSNIIVKTQGEHEGVTYNLAISSVVASATSAGTTSPLTTLNTRGLTNDEIATILTTAKDDAINSDGALNLGNFSVTGADISTDPLSGDLMDKTLSQITDAELSKIQASIATYALLKIMEGSTTLAALSGSDLVLSGATGGEVNLIARAILKAVSDALNTTLLTTIDGQITTARDAAITAGLPSSAATIAFPDVTMGLIVKVAVKVVDRLAIVGYTACNANTGTDSAKVTDAINAVVAELTNLDEANIMKMGKMLYGVINRSTLSAYATLISAADADLGAGVSSTATTFNFTATGGIE